jgi:hypothetical protein
MHSQPGALVIELPQNLGSAAAQADPFCNRRPITRAQDRVIDAARRRAFGIDRAWRRAALRRGIGPDGRRVYSYDDREGGCRQVKDAEVSASVGRQRPGAAALVDGDASARERRWNRGDPKGREA